MMVVSAGGIPSALIIVSFASEMNWYVEITILNRMRMISKTFCKISQPFYMGSRCGNNGSPILLSVNAPILRFISLSISEHGLSLKRLVGAFKLIYRAIGIFLLNNP